MDKYLTAPDVSLVLEYGNEELKLKMRNSNGQLQDTVKLPVLDYMLSSYKDLSKYLEVALQKGWITSLNVNVKIKDETGKEYPLPFEGGFRDIIFRCSESAFYSSIKDGSGFYISKGDRKKIAQVDDIEFSDFFNEFLFNVMSEEGHQLISNGYFSHDIFNKILLEYYDLKEKEDDMYAQERATVLEKGFVPSKAPKTIEDYLRFYMIFREAISFDLECRNLRREKPKEEETEEKINRTMRSLCFIIGNNCAPLVLKTLEAEELDNYIVDHFSSAKDVRRTYQDKIKEYILEHKEYVVKIREHLNNPSYNGQVSILEHQNGDYKRLANGAYNRFPVIYSSTFKTVKKLYSNIDVLRKLEKEKMSEEKKVEYQMIVKNAYDKEGLKYELDKTFEELESEYQDKKRELEEVKAKINRIVNAMKELEKEDYKQNEHRVFGPRVVHQIAFTKASGITKKYKMELDNWAKNLLISPYRYDQVRFIMRHLRKKDNNLLEKDHIEVLDDAWMTPAKTPTEPYYEEADNHQELILHPLEVEEMYGPDVDKETLGKANIHIHYER